MHDQLHEVRENARINTEGYERERILGNIDNVLREAINPRTEYARSLSDNDLQNKLEKTRDRYYEEYETYRRDKRPISELKEDPNYKKYRENYDLFYQLNTEKQRRYAEANPDKFPIHREHGWNLYKDE